MNVSGTWQNYWQTTIEGQHALFEGGKYLIEGKGAALHFKPV